MPMIIIDGRQIESAPGKTIIEAAYEHGLTIPHFCWHPALTVAGNCRMCLVNVGTQKKDAHGALLYESDGTPSVAWIPKMQIACATTVSEGMIVDTIGPKTVEAQNAVMEFLLINHPLDCPICDEAGQCKLQEYAFEHSKGKSRFDELKVSKPKRVELGPHVMFDGERCISCSRCIRYADEVAHQPVLTFVQRGDKVTIQTFPGTTFDSPYSMNVIDICPVGALTSIDFRFRARVWEMSFTDSICPGCARGCNVSLGVMDNKALRVEPRTNMHVNKYWMCDHGRLSTPGRVNDKRAEGPQIRRNGVLADATWDEALTEATKALKSAKANQIMLLGSAHASNEDNYALAMLTKSVLKTPNIDLIRHSDHTFGDTILKVNETAPNAIGAHVVGIAVQTGGHDVDQLAARIKHGDVKVLVVLADSADMHSSELAEAVAGVDHLIVISSYMTVTAHQASVLLPLATFAESEGTFANIMHRVQYFNTAVATQEQDRSLSMRSSRWDTFGAPNDRWSQGDRRNCRSGWSIIQSLANLLGASWAFRSSKDVFSDLAQHVSSFRGMTYDTLKEHQGLVLGNANAPEASAYVYESHVMKPQ